METKRIFQSKTIIGSVVTLLALSLSSFFGYEIGADDQTILVDTALNFIASAGAIVAIYGRIKASKKIEIK